MPHPALASTAHRPWSLPTNPWSLTMAWQNLLFLHWPVDVERLRRHVPAPLEVETHDGQAWLGVVPFVMARTRFRRLPPMPTAHRFPECNLRTYVRLGERPGVWFFSLDATSRLAVEGARLGFGLPYFKADMHCRRDGSQLDYASQRRDRRAPPARFAGRWSALGATRTAADPLERFLVERYCLYASRRGRLVRGEIAHAPWRLTPVELELDECDMTRLLDLQLPGPPVSALAAEALDVAAWSPVRC